MKARKILQYNISGKFMREWNSATHAANELGLHRTAIVSCCSGRASNNTVGGSVWRYHEDGYQKEIAPPSARGEKFRSLHGVGSDGHTAIKNKYRSTSILRHGVDHPMQNADVRERHKEASKIMYGVDNPAKSQRVREKISSTERSRKTRALLSEFPELMLMREVDGGFVFRTTHCNHEFEINRQLLVVRRNNGHTLCTVCNDVLQNQTSEVELSLYADVLRIHPGALHSVRGLVSTRHELDIYMPEHRLGIEVNGIKYHNTEYRDKDYHLRKTEMFESVGISVMHLFDDEVVDRRDVVMSMIASRTGTSRRIFARRLTLQEVPPAESIAFQRANHLQGSTHAKVHLGLYEGDVLAALMTFGHGRAALGRRVEDNGIWELVRYCSSLGTTVVGGAGRLLAEFERTRRPREVFTYANRRWSRGELYRQLGFTDEGVTELGYWYFYRNERVHRFALRKSVLARMGAVGRTEEEMAENLGIPRVYDCGNIRFRKTYS